MGITGIDTVPTDDSTNLITSGGVAAVIGSVVTENSQQSNVQHGNPMQQNNGTGSSLISQQANAVPNQPTVESDQQSRLEELLKKAMQNGINNTDIDDVVSGFTNL